MDMFNETRRSTLSSQQSDEINRILDDAVLNAYLSMKKPTILVRNKKVEHGPAREHHDTLDDSDLVHDPNTIILPPMNTDLNWTPLGRRRGQYIHTAYPSQKLNKLTTAYPSQIDKLSARSSIFAFQEEKALESGKVDDSDTVQEVATDSLVIPPLNTDIRLTNILPEFNMASFRAHFTRSEKDESLIYQDNFSWHITSPGDSPEIKQMKSLMHPVQNQHMCGSCWAMALSSCISNCFVISGAVNWSPKIAPTFIMMSIPSNMGNSQCDGGNPATTALALESIKIADTTCIDYSWCTNDADVCTSASAANHFRGGLSQKLNSNIPTPNAACYFEGDRYLYQIDKGSEALFITDEMPEENFRGIVKRHIIEYGPPIAGYAVLTNFVTGNFTDPNINQGVYFDRAFYPSSLRAGQPLAFSDNIASAANLSGLHAVEVMGWGLAKNVQYDTDKYGDVPYWWAKNSWGSSWGNMRGYFKIAMYPWNKYAQFGKRIRTQGSKVGGMILVRCTEKPTIGKLPRIHQHHLNRIVRSMDDNYYQLSPEEFANINAVNLILQDGEVNSGTLIYIGIAVVVVAAIVIFLMRRKI